MTWGPFLEGPVTFRTRKVVLSLFCVCIQGQSFNNFENDTIKLSRVNEVELTGL